MGEAMIQEKNRDLKKMNFKRASSKVPMSSDEWKLNPEALKVDFPTEWDVDGEDNEVYDKLSNLKTEFRKVERLNASALLSAQNKEKKSRNTSPGWSPVPDYRDETETGGRNGCGTRLCKQASKIYNAARDYF